MRVFIYFLFCIASLYSLKSQTPSYVPTNGLIGWWGFNGNANDGSGNGLPGGYCDVNGSFFFVHGSRSFGNWWSSSEYADNGVLYWVVNYVSSDLTFYSGNKNDGHSVRCIKD